MHRQNPFFILTTDTKKMKLLMPVKAIFGPLG